MSAPILTPSQLAGELAEVAERCAPSLPKQARAILMVAAGVYQETGEPALSIECQEAAARIKDLTAQPRSRPFVPRTASDRFLAAASPGSRYAGPETDGAA